MVAVGSETEDSRSAALRADLAFGVAFFSTCSHISKGIWLGDDWADVCRMLKYVDNSLKSLPLLRLLDAGETLDEHDASMLHGFISMSFEDLQDVKAYEDTEVDALGKLHAALCFPSRMTSLQNQMSKGAGLIFS